MTAVSIAQGRVTTFLTDEEVWILTGYRRYSRQVAWLDARGVHHYVARAPAPPTEAERLALRDKLPRKMREALKRAQEKGR